MPTYISLVQFTDKGIQAAKETTQRVADWSAKVQSKGVRINQMYWTLGQYDQVCISSMPRTTRRLPACCCRRTCWVTSARGQCVLSQPPRWRESCPRCPDLLDGPRGRSGRDAGMLLKRGMRGPFESSTRRRCIRSLAG